MKKDPSLEDYFLKPDATIREAVRRIDLGAAQTALIVDDHSRLLGVVTDGDVRRAILRDISLDRPITEIMTTEPKVLRSGTPHVEIVRQLKLHSLHQIPIVDEGDRVVALRTIDDFLGAAKLPNTVVIMAGGLGTRLKPITNEIPKPMVMIGGRPLLETTVSTLVSQGFFKFRISVNHLSDVIEDYFGDGSAWNADIQYLRESQPLGTAGSLRLLNETSEQPIIVMNGDLLTSLDFPAMLSFHETHGGAATIGVRRYRVEVPYGVIEHEDGVLTKLKEKPVSDFTINAGLYIIEPRVIDTIKAGQRMDMTSVCEALLAARERVGVYEIEEYWRDIGQIADLRSAQSEIDAISVLHTD